MPLCARIYIYLYSCLVTLPPSLPFVPCPTFILPPSLSSCFSSSRSVFLLPCMFIFLNFLFFHGLSFLFFYVLCSSLLLIAFILIPLFFTLTSSLLAIRSSLSHSLFLCLSTLSVFLSSVSFFKSPLPASPSFPLPPPFPSTVSLHLSLIFSSRSSSRNHILPSSFHSSLLFTILS